MLSKLLKDQESQETFLKQIKVNMLGQTQKVESQLTAIKQQEQQFGQIYSTLNQGQTGTLLTQ